MVKFNKYLTIIIRLFIVCLFLFDITNEGENIGVLCLTFLLTLYPNILKKLFNIDISDLLQVLISFIIVGAQCFGVVFSFYSRFYWWDTLLHTFSGFVFYFVGSEVWHLLNKNEVVLKNSLLILWGVFFSLSIALGWEILEFLIDTFKGTDMQVTGGRCGREAISDTMIDSIVHTVGIMIAIIISSFRKSDEINIHT